MGPPSATCNWHPLPGRRLPARVEAATGMGEQKENVPFVPLAYVAFYMYQSCFRCTRIANTNGMPRTPVDFSRSYVAATISAGTLTQSWNV